MTLNQMTVLTVFIMGDQSAREDAILEHEKLTKENKDWLMSPIGMYLESELTHPGSQISGLLKEKALKHLSKMIRV